MDPQLILGVANFGISAVFAVILLNLYSRQSHDIVRMSEEWTKRLIDLVEKTTAALTAVQGAVITLQNAVSALCEEVRRGKRRLERGSERGSE